MQIQDVIHLYIGCVAEFKQAVNKMKFIGTIKGLDVYYLNDPSTRNRVYEHIKPHLRPLSSMTETEKTIHLHRLMDATEGDVFECTEKAAEIIRQMASEGFDMFKLIERGLAIDITKENNQPL